MPTLTLEDVCLNIVDCEHKTAPIDPNGAFFAVGTPAMRGHNINLGAARRISEETFRAWTRRLTPESGDLLFAREAPVGPIVRIPATGNVAPGQRTVLLRPDPSRVDSKYLYYLFTSPRIQAEVQVKAEGSTVPHLNVADVRAFELPSLPPLGEQRAIAATLGAFDDKIKSNWRAIELSAELAQTQFAQWRKHAVFTEVSNFGQFADVYGGATPKTKVEEFWGGDLAWATPTDITGLSAPYLFSTSRAITQQGLDSCTAIMHPPGTILMTSRATIGAFAINQVPTATNQGFITVRPREELHRWFLFEEMRSRVDEFIGNANGSTFLELSRGRFKALPLDLPSPEALAKLHDSVDPLHTKAAQLVQENQKLAALRDALLPELLSGRMRVPEAQEIAA